MYFVHALSVNFNCRITCLNQAIWICLFFKTLDAALLTAGNRRSTEADDLPYMNELEWGYKNSQSSESDEIPPSHWSQVHPDCGGRRQSPIFIHSNEVKISNGAQGVLPLNFSGYDTGAQSDLWTVVNNGHTVQLSATKFAGPAPIAVLADETTNWHGVYDFNQMHFHWGTKNSRGSEHIIDNVQFPLELHLVHHKQTDQTIDQILQDPTGLAVIGMVFRVGSSQEMAALPGPYQHSLNLLMHAVKFARKPLPAKNITLPNFRLRDLLGLTEKGDRTISHYRYAGSLTTPPCAEVVQWIILKQPFLVSQQQMNIFRSIFAEDDEDDLIGDNFRPVQQLNSRTITYYPDAVQN